jgi:hypothetical protein
VTLRTLFAAMLGVVVTSARADYRLYNQTAPPTPNAGGTANFGAAGFNLRLDDPAFTVDVTGGSTLPLPSSLRLTSLGLVRGSGGNSPAINTNQHYLKVFGGTPSAATFVGASTNFQDFDDTSGAAVNTYAFAGLDLATSTTYVFAFATNNSPDASGLGLLGRVQGSNLAADVYAGMFLNPDYTTNADATRDPMLLIGATTVPEPTTLSFLAGGLLALRRRRR